MILISWLFDKLGYMPKITVDTNLPFPATQQDYVQHEFEKPIKRKPVAKKTVTKKTVKKKS